MAKRLGNAEPKPTTSAPEGADDLSVLHPDVTVKIAGRSVTIREYGFTEGLRVRAYMAPFTADLGRLFDAGEVLVEDVLDVVGAHVDLVQRAMAQSIAPAGELASDQDIAWVAQLDDTAGDALVNHWWGVCGLFFVRQIVRRSGERAKRATLARAAAQAKATDGQTSTSSSSAPASARPSSSDDTPPASSSSSTSDSPRGGTDNGPT
ncbi:DUF6631 family protein [Fulvimonas yonginensis]|uniref:DUF6631 family protein n=1 Tax=Fulvimonas yonginensis TaxID=1495200 RepID=A0ABU8JA96_9GAMM